MPLIGGWAGAYRDSRFKQVIILLVLDELIRLIPTQNSSFGRSFVRSFANYILSPVRQISKCPIDLSTEGS